MTDIPRFCTYCGNQLRPNARFCNRCGRPAPLPAAVSPAPIPAQPGQPPGAAAPLPTPQPTALPETRDRRQMWIIVAIVAAMGLLLVCALGIGGYWWVNLRETATPTITGSVTATNTGTITPPTPTPTGTITPPTSTPTGTITPATATGAPAATQTPVPTTAPAASVNFSGVSFAYHPILAAGISTEKLPARTGPDVSVFELAPEHVLFSLRGYPFVPDEQPLPQVRVYPLAALESLDPEIALEVSGLRDLLNRKPTDLVNPDETIPFLPLQNANQVFQACIGYLSFRNGNGVRYVTQYNQDTYPIYNNGIFYTFQGLTNDGKYYISASFPISNGILPDPNSVVIDNNFRNNFNSYIRSREVEMSSQPATSFNPDLSLLDALIQSLQVQ